MNKETLKGKIIKEVQTFDAMNTTNNRPIAKIESCVITFKDNSQLEIWMHDGKVNLGYWE
jgi:hypothetical protein